MPPTLSGPDREVLLSRLTAVIDDFFESSTLQPSPAAPDTIGGYAVLAVEPLEDGFEHRWPDRKATARYGAMGDGTPAARYTVRTDAGNYSLLIGAEEGGRSTHGLPGRGRVVVFVQRGSGGAELYPLVEFAATDLQSADGHDLYAARIARPGDPRKAATATHLEQVRQVPHLRTADIQRGDDIYTHMQNGPSLYLVVPINDVETMLAHAIWVGQMRGGGRLPRPA